MTIPDQELIDVGVTEVIGGGALTRAEPSIGTSYEPVVNRTLRDLLGWAPKQDDVKGFVAAISRSYRIVEIEGIERLEWTPYGYTLQADIGAITGAQASIAKQGQLILAEIERLIDGLVPLRVDFDPQNVEASKAIVRYQLEQLVEQLGSEGGPNVELVDNLWLSLFGDSVDNDPEALDADSQLGKLQRRFGFYRLAIGTIEEEQGYTNFLMIHDYARSLYLSWQTQSLFFGGPLKQGQTRPAPYLGTQLVLVARALEAVQDSVQQALATLDNVGIGQSERQVITIQLEDGGTLFLQSILSWAEKFSAEDARGVIESAGREGVAALLPSLEILARAFDRAVPPISNVPALYNTPLVKATMMSVALNLREVYTLSQALGEVAEVEEHLAVIGDLEEPAEDLLVHGAEPIVWTPDLVISPGDPDRILAMKGRFAAATTFVWRRVGEDDKKKDKDAEVLEKTSRDVVFAVEPKEFDAGFYRLTAITGSGQERALGVIAHVEEAKSSK